MKLVGRHETLEAVGAALERAGAVSLHGPPGVGKSALAARWAERERDDGARTIIVELGGVETEAALRTALAHALGSWPGEAETPEDLGRALRAHAIELLVLDDADGCLEHVARGWSTWQRSVPHLRCLVVARRTLLDAAWTRVPVEPLSPAEARALFSACRSRLGLDPTFSEDTLGPLLRASDGLPLAIEIAAARSAVEPLDRIVPTLDTLVADSVAALDPATRAVWSRRVSSKASWTRS